MSTPLFARRSTRGVITQQTDSTPPAAANNNNNDTDDSLTDSSDSDNNNSNSNKKNNKNNKLREALDDGVLTIRKNYQEFCVFLDIKKELRSEFLSSLWNHVAQGEYEWETLASDLPERRECATSFITKVGVKYWGTEENRRRCLMPDSFDSPELMFTYPERKHELIRVIMILLEKKAKIEVNNNSQPRKRPLKAASPKNGFSPSLSESPCPPKQKRKRRSGAGHRSSAVYTDSDFNVSDSDFGLNDSKATVEVVVTSSPKKGNSAASSPAGKLTSTSQSKTKKQNVSKNNTGGEKPVDHDNNKSLLRNGLSLDDEFAHLEEKFGMYTRYLVKATDQEGMAPVFVPFKRFDTVSSFLETMEEETRLQEWNPSTQLDVELRRQMCTDDSPVDARIYHVLAASVRFEWSNFEIRLRPGRDNDLREMTDELHRSWLKVEQSTNSEEGVDEADGGDPFKNRYTTFFKIHVMLHVSSLQ